MGLFLQIVCQTCLWYRRLVVQFWVECFLHNLRNVLIPLLILAGPHSLFATCLNRHGFLSPIWKAHIYNQKSKAVFFLKKRSTYFSLLHKHFFIDYFDDQVQRRTFCHTDLTTGRQTNSLLSLFAKPSLCLHSQLKLASENCFDYFQSIDLSRFLSKCVDQKPCMT